MVNILYIYIQAEIPGYARGVRYQMLTVALIFFGKEKIRGNHTFVKNKGGQKRNQLKKLPKKCIKK